MGFQKGHKLATGRPSGSPNKDKKIVREIVEQALGRSIPERLLDIAKQHPRQEQAILEGLMPYCYAKLQSVELSGELDTPATDAKLDEIVKFLKEVKED